MSKKDYALNLRISVETRALLERLAEEDNTTFTAVITHLIEAEVRRRQGSLSTLDTTSPYLKKLAVTIIRHMREEYGEEVTERIIRGARPEIDE